MSQGIRPPVWLIAFLLVLAFAFQGTRGLWEPDEGRYSATGLNMLATGDWLVPTIDREHPHLTKPPITYWALAASFGLLGRNEWAARLPAGLAFVGTGLLVFGLGRRLCPSKPWLPSVVHATSLAPFMGGNVVSTDILLTFFETAAMYAFVRAWTDPGRMDPRWTRRMWVLFGLAFMTKGPPGLLPLLAMAGMLLLADRKALRGLFNGLGILAFAVVAFSWFAILVAEDPARLRYFIGYEVYDRVFTSMHGRNAEWYGALLVYVPTLVLGTLPWWPLALVAGGGPRRCWTVYRQHMEARNRDWLLVTWWFALPFAIFCLAQSRLQLYILPLFVPLSLAMARPLAGWSWLRGLRLGAVVAVTAAALIALKAFAGHVGAVRDSRQLASTIRSFVDPREFDGIVFVGVQPYYGLTIYLDLPVENVEITDQPLPFSKYRSTEDLCSELADDETNAYVVKNTKTERFREAVVHCVGREPTLIGEFVADDNHLALYRVHSARQSQ